MNKEKIIRHFIGYLIGFTIFLVLIPWGLIRLSGLGHQRILISIILENSYVRIIISSIVFLIGIIFGIWSNIDLFRIGRGGPTDGFGVAISPRTERLVISGPYRYTRNPMVFGAFFCYFSIALFQNSLICLAVLIGLLPLVVVYLKNTEEKRLVRDFGDEYKQYRKKVSMIFPLPPRKG